MIAIKGIEKQTDCKNCPLMGIDGNRLLSPMMCIGIWAVTREIKYCVEGGVREDCPLTEIVTCGKCDHCEGDMVEGIEYLWCRRENCATSEDYYCGSGERRE